MSLSSGGLAREYGFTDLDGSVPDCWRYVAEVQCRTPASRPMPWCIAEPSLRMGGMARYVWLSCEEDSEPQ